MIARALAIGMGPTPSIYGLRAGIGMCAAGVHVEDVCVADVCAADGCAVDESTVGADARLRASIFITVR